MFKLVLTQNSLMLTYAKIALQFAETVLLELLWIVYHVQLMNTYKLCQLQRVCVLHHVLLVNMEIIPILFVKHAIYLVKLVMVHCKLIV